ncbi:cytochrome-c peroxidase [Aureococcus anophagefferens]|nr:cytochrome-c peroxidase [Aureococcus anophagefferens]
MGSTVSTIDDPAGVATNAVDLRAAREDIAKWLHRPEHDDGSLAPLMIRFAWHCCGTYDRHKKSGGSNGGTMRFLAEQADPEKQGFAEARALVEKVKRAPAPQRRRHLRLVRHGRHRSDGLGFDDRETVALILLGHQYGRCHPEVSGNENAWYAFDPAHWNLFEHGLGYLSVYGNIDQFVERTTAKGKRQFEWDMHG